MQAQIDSQQPDVGTDPMIAKPTARAAKMLGSLVFYIGSELWRRACRVVGRTPPAIVTCIYYHHVLDGERDKFAAQMDHLIRWTTPLSPEDSKTASRGRRYIIVTADDGWKSFADNAVPELAKRNIPVTVFVISDRLGRTVDNLTGDRIISETELQTLGAAVTIASHTATHARMTALSQTDARRELIASRLKLSELSGSPVTALCFPYGAVNPELVALAHECGYEQVYAGIPGRLLNNDSIIGRLRVDPTDWKLEFHLKIVGAYRWVPRLLGIKQAIIARRRDKRHLVADRVSSS